MLDGVVADDSNQLGKLWFLREEVGSAVFGYGYTLTYDVSLPNESYYECVNATRALIENSSLPGKEKLVTTGFGHIGDGNLHVNVSLPGYEDKALQEAVYSLVDPFVMEFTRKHKGSVSAEHGVGL